MFYLISIFFILYFKEFYELLIHQDHTILNSNFLVYGISHYEGWIIVISFFILLYYINKNYKTSDNSSQNSIIFSLMCTLVLKKIILRKRYMDQLYFVQFMNLLFLKFQSDLQNNINVLNKLAEASITVSMLKKLQFFNIYTSRINMDRIYLL